MKTFVDESGQYRFHRSDGFESFTLAGLIVPDSYLGEVEEFVDWAKRRWRRSELHAVRLRPEWVLEICRFISSRPFTAVALVTDNEILTPELITDFRIRQAVQVSGARDRYVRGGGHDPERLAEIDEVLRQVGLATVVSDAEFVQQMKVPELLFSCVQRALDRFPVPHWRPDFERLEFAFDAKLADRLSPGERLTDAQLMRMIGSTRRFILELPSQWRTEPDHPFIRRFFGATACTGPGATA